MPSAGEGPPLLTLQGAAGVHTLVCFGGDREIVAEGFRQLVASLPAGEACAMLRQMRVTEQPHAYGALLQANAELLFDNMFGGDDRKASDEAHDTSDGSSDGPSDAEDAEDEDAEEL